MRSLQDQSELYWSDIIWDRILYLESLSVVHLLVLAGLSIGAGMIIHGVQWAVLSFFENRGVAVFKRKYHVDRSLASQVLCAPWIIVYELWKLFSTKTGIGEMALEDNICQVNDDSIPSYEALQEFYLNFAQFYAHMSYALLLLLLVTITHVVYHALSYTPVPIIDIEGIAICLVVWLLCGVFFVIGRIQFVSLFKAEQKLALSSPRIRVLFLPQEIKEWPPSL